MSSIMLDSTNLQTIADDLAAISGSEHLSVDNGTVSIAPASTEEIAAVLRYANENNIAVAPYGGGTKQSWGNPIHPSLILHTRRLGAVREHTWQDMTCIVKAGCIWSSMQSSLAKHGQFVALDPLWPRSRNNRRDRCHQRLWKPPPQVWQPSRPHHWHDHRTC